MIKNALDEEETARIEVYGNNILIILDIPFTEMEENSLTYSTYPLSIILSVTMAIFASIISNNLNIVMKFLASITIVLTISNIISELFLMNLTNPLASAGTTLGFWAIVNIIAALCGIAIFFLYKRDMF